MKSAEYLLIQECIESKKTRERTIKYIQKNHNDIMVKIIDLYDLKRINDKYISCFRNYDENSYSKKKIKYEELVLIRKCYLFLKISISLDKHIELKIMVNRCTGNIIDDYVYKEKDLELYDYLFNEFYKKIK